MILFLLRELYIFFCELFGFGDDCSCHDYDYPEDR